MKGRSLNSVAVTQLEIKRQRKKLQEIGAETARLLDTDDPKSAYRYLRRELVRSMGELPIELKEIIAALSKLNELLGENVALADEGEPLDILSEFLNTGKAPHHGTPI